MDFFFVFCHCAKLFWVFIVPCVVLLLRFKDALCIFFPPLLNGFLFCLRCFPCYFCFSTLHFFLSFFFVWLLIYILLSLALIFSLKVNSWSISLVAFLWILSLCLSFSSTAPSWLGARLSCWWSHSFQKSFNNWLCLTRQVSLFQGVLGTSPCHLFVCLASQILFFGFLTAFHTFVSRVLFKTLPFVSCWSVLFYVILLFAFWFRTYIYFYFCHLCACFWSEFLVAPHYSINDLYHLRSPWVLQGFLIWFTAFFGSFPCIDIVCLHPFLLPFPYSWLDYCYAQEILLDAFGFCLA